MGVCVCDLSGDYYKKDFGHSINDMAHRVRQLMGGCYSLKNDYWGITAQGSSVLFCVTC